jgi:hypothetical protein
VSDTPTDDIRVRDLLQATKVGQHERVEGRGLDPRMRLLRTWQSERLTRTHADLLAHPRYGPAGRFFLSDVYAPRDFSQRDHDIIRMYHAMRLILPAVMQRALEIVIELNALTTRLDEELLSVLIEELGVTDALTVEQYAEGYRRCDNYDERVRQIDLIVAVGAEIDVLVGKPGVALALKLARIPARLAGWHEMQDFFEHGFEAFRHMNGAEEFLRTIASRERAILDRIYASDPDPFAIG